MPFQYHIREMTVETSAEDFVTRFVHVEKFLPFCQQCSSYNTRWTCPPFDFDPMTIWRSYTGLRLYARILQADVPEQPLDEALAALKQEKRLYRQELQRWERETPGSQMLLAGTCDQCETCERYRDIPAADRSCCATPSRRWAAMWRAVCSTTSTCPCCGAGMAKRRTTLCWWAVCSLSDNEK